MPTLTDATARLYAVVPEEFLPTRTLLAAEAKAAGDAGLAKQIGALRKPTTAAWAVNATVREHPAEREALVAVGQRLRAAQARLDAARIRDLRTERDDVLARFVEAAQDEAALAGRQLAPAVLDEVRGTLIAALASEEASDAVVSGTLTRALSYSGFGEVDLSQAVARTSSGAVLTVVGDGAAAPEAVATTSAPAGPRPQSSRTTTPGRKTRGGPEAEDDPKARAAMEARAAQEAEARARRLREADARLEQASADLDAAMVAAEAARERAAQARQRVRELEADLAAARAEHRSAEAMATEAVRARTAAQAARHTAEQELAAAQRADARPPG